MSFHLPQSSSLAANVDSIFDFILITSLISFVIIVFGKFFFLVRFWRKKKPEQSTPYITGHTATEVSVAVLLTVWVMVIFYMGWVGYKKLRAAPPDALEINIIGRQWMWEAQYPDGRRLTNEVVVPRNKPVKLIMTSKDVIHSFFVPDFRVKQDVVPNMYTSLWFEATEVGDHPVYCAEYCGAGHSAMLAKVKVLEPQDFEAWEYAEATKEAGAAPGGAAAGGAAAGGAAQEKKSLADKGKEIFSGKGGCQACHTITGEARIGPTLKGIFGKQVELADGTKVTVDENYIRESLMEPNKKIVKGFQPLMPTMKGLLNEEEINALIALIKGLKEKGESQ